MLSFFWWAIGAAEVIQSGQKYKQHGDGDFVNNL